MSNAGVLHSFSNNKPLQTIAESTNSDYEFTDRGDPRIKQWENIYKPAKPGAEEWETSSDSSAGLDEGSDSLRTEVHSTMLPVGPRTSSKRHALLHESDSSDHASAQRSSPRGSGTFSVEGSNTEATSAIPPSLKEEHLENEGPPVMPLDDFDLAAPKDGSCLHSLETLSDFLFAGEHLKNVFADPNSLLNFTSFLSSCRPKSIPMLMYYLDTTEALKAVNYAITIAQSLEPISDHEFTTVSVKTNMNVELEEKAEKAFNVLVKEDLPAFATQIYVQTVKSNMIRRIMGPSAPPMQEGPDDGMLEVFCLTDPSRPDNPIVFASKAFHQMTQYSLNYVIGRNCRFLQGPKTDQSSINRIRKSLEEGRDHCELILNYRRDGSPFLNLLMLAPLRDINGTIRYVLGAQVDVSNLVPDSTDLDSAASRKAPQLGFMSATAASEKANKTDDSREASEMLDVQDRRNIQKWRARTLQEQADDDIRSTDGEFKRPGLLVRDMSFDSMPDNHPEGWVNSKLSGFYQNYLLIRPYPSLRVLFASPSLRIPGILQSPVMDKIGGSPRVREDLTQALAQGRSVTATVRWITKPGDRGHNRWIAFTPLVGSHRQIGVWIAILVDDELDNEHRPRQAPPVKFRPVPENRLPPPKRSISEQKPPVPDKEGVVDVFWEKSVVADKPLPSPKELPASTPPASEVDRSIAALVPEVDQGYETLEQRLRKKRERDAARLLAQPDAPIKPTYKSLSPYAFMNNNNGT